MKSALMILGALDRFLFPEVGAEFFSLYSLPESIDRLRAAGYRKGLFSQVLGGKFREDSVMLYRVIPFFGSPYAPVFTGSFQRDGDRLVLRGRFKARQGLIVYLYCLLALVAIFGVLMLPAFVIHPGTTWLALLVWLGIIILSVGQLRLSQWLRRNDASWISRAIRRAISEPAARSLPPSKPPGWLRRKFVALSSQ